MSETKETEEQQADFGYRRVPIGEKQALVSDVFRSVAGRYDLMNDLMSFGLHRAWKDALVTAINPPQNRPFLLLDAAGGTGDIALRVIAAGGAQTRAIVCDINEDMLAVGRERASRRAGGFFTPRVAEGQGEAEERITFTEANAEALPFADRTFDAATIAFGIRNVPGSRPRSARPFASSRSAGAFCASSFPPSTCPACSRSMISIRFA